MNDNIGQGGEEWLRMEAGMQDCMSEESLSAVREAKGRIDRVRKGDVELRLVDRQGQALANVPVEVVLKKHAFCFGDQLWGLDRMYRFGEGQTDKARYFKRLFADCLNACTALCYWTERGRNDGAKTEDIQGQPQYDGFRWCVDWGMSEGLTVKGHPLFWSIDKCVPDWVKRYDYETQMKFAEVRVRTLIAAGRGRVKIWDVVNEALWEPAFKNLAQRNWPHLEKTELIAEYIAEVLRWAREEDPDATYIVNDYGLQGKDEDRGSVAADGTKVVPSLQRKRNLELFAALTEAGACPDAMGLQSHTGGWASHADQAAVYDELSACGLGLHITEFWARTKALEETGKLSQAEIDNLQADYVENYLTTAFGHPAVDAFFFWGLMGWGIDWGQASSHEPKAVYHRVKKLIHEDWTTRQQLRTDGDGVVRFRGFYGDYSLRVRQDSGQESGTPFVVQRGAEGPMILQAPLPAAAVGRQGQ
ncbi:MAG: endo-1,4-beta-xylanase [Planctomycetota bacterium]